MRNKLLITTALMAVSFALSANAEGNIVVNAGDSKTISENLNDNSAKNGAAVYNNGNLTVENNISFQNNSAKEVYTTQMGNMGGAIYSEGTATSKNTVKIGNNVNFSGNEAGAGGALYLFGQHSVTIGEHAVFDGNKAETGGGGAITIVGNGGVVDVQNGDIALTIGENALFKNNEASYGGAINNNTPGASVTLSSGTQFVANKASGVGGAIANLDKINATGVTFKENTAKAGGAVYNWHSGRAETVATFKDSTFSGNIAQNEGGAIYNTAQSTINFSGNNVFSENKAGDKLNDIYNLGEIDVAKGAVLELDGGITGKGRTLFAEDTTLKINTLTKMENKITSSGTTLKVNIDEDVEKINLTAFLVDNVSLAENGLYNFVKDSKENGEVYKVSEKSASEVASSLGLTGTETAALMAALSNEAEEDSVFEAIQGKLDTAAQDKNLSAVREVEKLGADAAPIVRTVETMRSNMVFAAVNDELNGADGAMAEGVSAGDYFRKAKAWIRGLFNYADKDGTSKSQGFDADTYGVAMGIDKELDNHIKAGFGYAYSQTDVNGDTRDTDVDSHTLFVYGKYQPADWYVNSVLAYSWSDYEEKKSVFGYNANAKYDVNTIALQSMYGFERKLGEYDLNPEFGFRYMHIEQDGYTDNLGAKIKAKDSDVLTAVAGAKIAKSYELESGRVLRPELKAALTYDVVADNNNANVVLPNGAGYRVNGDKLERLGLELGAKVATAVADKWEISAGYEVRLREDYQDNTLMFNAKYNF